MLAILTVTLALSVAGLLTHMGAAILYDYDYDNPRRVPLTIFSWIAITVSCLSTAVILVIHVQTKDDNPDSPETVASMAAPAQGENSPL